MTIEYVSYELWVYWANLWVFNNVLGYQDNVNTIYPLWAIVYPLGTSYQTSLSIKGKEINFRNEKWAGHILRGHWD